MTSEPSQFPVIRGRTVRVDDQGRVCLNDIHRAAGFSVHQSPAQWQRLPFVTQMMVALLKRNVGKSHNSKVSMSSIICATRGANGGTYADMRLALAYAEYLNADLAIEVKEVFLRYKAADPALADEVLERASPEANEWAGKRALARAGRGPFTATLQRHGVRLPFEYASCTNAIYIGLFSKTAKQLKAAKHVRSNLRDAMDAVELTLVATGEALARERIEQTECQGAIACEAATLRSTSFLRQAIEAERADRKGNQQRLV